MIGNNSYPVANLSNTFDVDGTTPHKGSHNNFQLFLTELKASFDASACGFDKTIDEFA